jgi:hypothetical protein
MSRFNVLGERGRVGALVLSCGVAMVAASDFRQTSMSRRLQALQLDLPERLVVDVLREAPSHVVCRLALAQAAKMLDVVRAGRPDSYCRRQLAAKV